MEYRECTICFIKKELTLQFFMQGKNKRNGIDYFYWYKFCKTCYNKKSLTKTRKYKSKNRQKLLNAQKIYYQNHKKEYAVSSHSYYEINKVHIKARVKNFVKLRRKNDALFRLKENISSIVRSCINKNRESIKKYLPYTISELKEHLENQFEFWMSWQNYGTYRLDIWDDTDPKTWAWQIDHIIPHSNFDYHSMNDQQFKDCWALSNLRPYSAKQNIIDNNRRF